MKHLGCYRWFAILVGMEHLSCPSLSPPSSSWPMQGTASDFTLHLRSPWTPALWRSSSATSCIFNYESPTCEVVCLLCSCVIRWETNCENRNEFVCMCVCVCHTQWGDCTHQHIFFLDFYNGIILFGWSCVLDVSSILDHLCIVCCCTYMVPRARLCQTSEKVR